MEFQSLYATLSKWLVLINNIQSFLYNSTHFYQLVKKFIFLTILDYALLIIIDIINLNIKLLAIVYKMVYGYSNYLVN